MHFKIGIYHFTIQKDFNLFHHRYLKPVFIVENLGNKGQKGTPYSQVFCNKSL